jgi:hypothetical protein
MVVFIWAHDGIRGGVHLGQSHVDHGGCHLREHLAEHGGVHLWQIPVASAECACATCCGAWGYVCTGCRLQLPLSCLLQLSARVLAGMEHCVARRSSSTWSIVVFN